MWPNPIREELMKINQETFELSWKYISNPNEMLHELKFSIDNRV